MPVDCAGAQFSRGLAREETEIPKLRVYVLYKKKKKRGENFFWSVRERGLWPATAATKKFFCRLGQSWRLANVVAIMSSIGLPAMLDIVQNVGGILCREIWQFSRTAKTIPKV